MMEYLLRRSYAQEVKNDEKDHEEREEKSICSGIFIIGCLALPCPYGLRLHEAGTGTMVP